MTAAPVASVVTMSVEPVTVGDVCKYAAAGLLTVKVTTRPFTGVKPLSTAVTFVVPFVKIDEEVDVRVRVGTVAMGLIVTFA